ncbi:MAG: iron-containing alcohol dehydrogenase [Desulfurococcaceae archaeon]
MIGEFSFRYNDVVLHFGVGVLKKIFTRVVSGHSNALVISSRTAARVSGALEDVTSALRSAGVSYIIYDKILPNPDTETADTVIDIAKRENVDLVIGIGGGSVIDVAKVVSLAATTELRSIDLIRGSKQTRASADTLKLVAVNLTHGTGSEVNRFAVLTVKGTIEKRGFTARYPDVSFDDPYYTRTLDRNQSIYTSLDAFYHAYESATSRRTNIMVSSLAQIAITHIVESLPKVLEDPSCIELRARLLYASMIAGLAVDIAGGSHLNHALEHGFSGLQPKLPHGAGLAMFGPTVIYYTHKAVPEVSARLLKALDPSIKPISDDAEKARKIVEDFQKSIGFSERLSDYGISEKDVAPVLDFVERTIVERYHANIPFTVSRGMLERIVLSVL